MHRVLIGVVVTGAVIIAGIGFAGSYAAVRELAIKKGFGNFSYVFPIGIDAGICVLLAMDLLLTWIRIPFPLLRQTAWLLTAATIAFNGAAAWPDPLGVGMHAVIPVLFVVAVEAARHAIGRIADITADKHMEGVRMTRWLLSPVPTFLLWRRMKLWELRSYDQVIKLEQERLVYQARLRSRFGRAWRRKAPVESLMPLRLAKYGVPLAETAPSGLAAAGIEPAVLPPAAPLVADDRAVGAAPVPQRTAPPGEQRPQLESAPAAERPEYAGQPQQAQQPGYVQRPEPAGAPAPDESPWLHARHPQEVPYQGGYDPTYDPTYDPSYDAQYVPEEQYEDWYEDQEPDQYQQPSMEETGSFPIPAGPGRTRQLGEGATQQPQQPQPTPQDPASEQLPIPTPREEASPLSDEKAQEEAYYQVFRQSIDGSYPTPRVLGDNIQATYGTTLSASALKTLAERFQNRHTAELEEDHIA
ncbi:hypothetical protein SGFS_069500 [Streptomyces graminofaciens]|uniref:Integral membrane protein n=1 Tax=Streptomyces graminofaciens TaxID=68212 RepID=A0ABM7FHC7_9ACTN|nr:DUF2637 domain-containing protein [Streptomyces graminofaciens]BBC35656.1 hypothetical protein SGFS_069500 [Streptomyces graminofaciens]